MLWPLTGAACSSHGEGSPRTVIFRSPIRGYGPRTPGGAAGDPRTGSKPSASSRATAKGTTVPAVVGVQVTKRDLVALTAALRGCITEVRPPLRPGLRGTARPTVGAPPGHRGLHPWPLGCARLHWSLPMVQAESSVCIEGSGGALPACKRGAQCNGLYGKPVPQRGPGAVSAAECYGSFFADRLRPPVE